jgi:hypothetical protein
MKKLNRRYLVTLPEVEIVYTLVNTINELIDEIDKLKDQLKSVHKDRPDPKSVNPYTPRKRR